MKLEYIQSGSSDCPLIRLYDFAPSEAGRLYLTLTTLASGAIEPVHLHNLPGVEAIGGCQLVLAINKRDRGIVKKADSLDFECLLTPETWHNVAGRVESLATGDTGYQWLTDDAGDAKLLLSVDGKW